jgi:hypothetical protein
MPDNSNDWRFKRGLDKPFLLKLEVLAKETVWFADVLADPDLILGIRDNYVNVYWRGQSLFKIDWNGADRPLKVSTHPKYLIDPELPEALQLVGEAFDVGGHQALTTKYVGPATLKNMKSAAKLYCGDEKKGVHALIRANPDVIDTEVTFNNKKREDEKERLLPRIDIACFEEEDGEILLRFWEAKLYENGEIRAEGDTEPPVLAQVRGYRKLVEKHRDEIIESYQKVARNLVEIAGWPGCKRKLGDLIKQVAGGGRSFTIGNPRSVGLVVYKFDDAQKKSSRWTKDMAKLERETLMPLCRVGDPKGFKLRTRSR